MVSCEGIQDFLVGEAFATSLGFCMALKINNGPFEGSVGVGLQYVYRLTKSASFVYTIMGQPREERRGRQEHPSARLGHQENKMK
jgi:hypothetical protein